MFFTSATRCDSESAEDRPTFNIEGLASFLPVIAQKSTAFSNTEVEEESSAQLGLCEVARRAPPSEESLSQLGDVLGYPELGLCQCLYVGNISVRADKAQIVNMMNTLGNLLCFEFVIRDKQFRFQGGVAIFKESAEKVAAIKTRPFLVYKRKLRVSELSSRNNTFILLAVLLKKLTTPITETSQPQAKKKKTKEASRLNHPNLEESSKGQKSSVQMHSCPVAKGSEGADKETIKNVQLGAKNLERSEKSTESTNFTARSRHPAQEIEKHSSPSGESDTLLSEMSISSEALPALIIERPSENTQQPEQLKANVVPVDSRTSVCLLLKKSSENIAGNHANSNVRFNEFLGIPRRISQSKATQPSLPAASTWRGLFF